VFQGRSNTGGPVAPLFDEGFFEAQEQGQVQPRLISLRRADVRNLVLADLDLGPCLFENANNLDQLHIEGSYPFADTPRRVIFARAWPPVWMWTRRQTLAEEHLWRLRWAIRRNDKSSNGTSTALRPKGIGWYPQRCHLPDWLEEKSRPVNFDPDAKNLASIYRALRKGREDSKDEPGAADFYYGEMEMRRRATSTPKAEKLILWLYWFFSGYALRAWRALSGLFLVIVLLAWLLTPTGVRRFRWIGSYVSRSASL
jgi:hypothetical protein